MVFFVANPRMVWKSEIKRQPKGFDAQNTGICFVGLKWLRARGCVIRTWGFRDHCSLHEESPSIARRLERSAGTFARFIFRRGCAAIYFVADSSVRAPWGGFQGVGTFLSRFHGALCFGADTESVRQGQECPCSLDKMGRECPRPRRSPHTPARA